ncbi:MAG TPA: peptidylprolyl isomerase [Spirochaetota bacterium]|nr:MAG: Chaperone SurA precursor [Spirochaetes bacterium ADurb.BinA120]HPI14199.1 peptidylprolyl isomerase [Spirochaetota bacterium]HPO46702.1 peptidylprolyl isomerase [Spirochaetota bacterium]
MKLIARASLYVLIVLTAATASHSWEPFDRVIAVVNDRPIVESEVAGRLDRLRQRKNVPANRLAYERSRLLDRFIEDSIVLQEAEQQSIVVSDEKVTNHIKKLMARMNITSMDDFKKRVEKVENLPFDEYREDVRKSLITEQVMSLAIGVTPPSRKEAMEWYNANKAKLGFEINVKHILIRPKNPSLAEEKRVIAEINALRQRIVRGEPFEQLAAQHSEDPGSAKKGGAIGWMSLAELDPYFANQVFRMADGQLSGAIKSGFDYHLVKFLGKRPVTFDSVEDRIVGMLFQQKLSEQFSKWVIQRRRESEVIIYMEDYVKA